MTPIRKVGFGLMFVVLSMAGFWLGPLPGWLERAIGGVAEHAPYAIRPEVASRHASLRVVDWHSDSLLWKRNLLDRGERGHVDFPRLAEGNVAVQMFTAVTKVPMGQNYEENTGDSDMITLLALVQRWPMATWGSLAERALYQANKMRDYAEFAPDVVRLVRTSEDLRAVLTAQSDGSGPIAALLGIEGAHALDGDLANLDALYDAGIRMVGLHHFFDNKLGGSLHGQSRGGLTEFGRAVVARLQQKQMIIDVAHSSPAVVDDVVELATRGIVISHTGLYGKCPSPRNLRDDQMQRVAAHGGLIAVGYWDGAICDTSPAGVVSALRYAIDLVGVDHVSLGSDFDGATTPQFDTSELAILTQEMIDAGFSEQEIAKVMGENAIRLLLEQLPGGDVG